MRFTFIFFAFTLFFVLFNSLPVYANSTGTIKAVVRVAVCGDNIKDSIEECDGSDLGDQSCSTLGYSSGTLLCSSSCNYNVYNCFNRFNSDQQGQVLGVADSINSSVGEPKYISSVIRPSKKLPLKLDFYDADNNGVIEYFETFYLAKKWKDYYDSNNISLCDLEGDKKCSIKDLSVALYYVKR